MNVVAAVGLVATGLALIGFSAPLGRSSSRSYPSMPESASRASWILVGVAFIAMAVYILVR